MNSAIFEYPKQASTQNKDDGRERERDARDVLLSVDRDCKYCVAMEKGKKKEKGICSPVNEPR